MSPCLRGKELAGSGTADNNGGECCHDGVGRDDRSQCDSQRERIQRAILADAIVRALLPFLRRVCATRTLVWSSKGRLLSRLQPERRSDLGNSSQTLAAAAMGGATEGRVSYST